MVTFRESQLVASGARITPAYNRRLIDLGSKLEAAGRMLDSLSYERVLDRGFALVEGADGMPVSKASSLTAGDQLNVRFADGKAAVEVLGDDGSAMKTSRTPLASKPKKAPQKKTKTDDLRQGSLL